jgi:hypothetical protein
VIEVEDEQGAGETPLDRLLDLAVQLEVSPEDLDDAVHDLYSKRASDVNNGGLSGQLEFMLGEMNEKAVEEVLRESR